MSSCSEEIIFRNWAGLPPVFIDWQFSMTTRSGKSFRLAVSCCGPDLDGGEVAFGKLKLNSGISFFFNLNIIVTIHFLISWLFIDLNYKSNGRNLCVCHLLFS